MRNVEILTALLGSGRLPLLAGCSVAKTAVDVAMVPVHVATAGVNAVVPSQKKADEKRGREMRKEDEERGKQVRSGRRIAAAREDRCRPTIAQRRCQR